MASHLKAYQFPDNQFTRVVDETSRRLMAEYFKQRGYITGAEVLHFSRVEQVNRFLLFQLNQDLRTWTRQLEHPYVDIQAEPVQEALQALQNILSQHIRIAQPAFGPLVEKAVFNTLRLLLSPHDTLTRFFYGNQQEVKAERFTQYVNYFSDFDFLAQGILGYVQKNNLPTLPLAVFDEKINRLAELFTEKRGISIEDYRAQRFQQLTGYELKSFSTKSFDYATIEEKPTPPARVNTPPTPPVQQRPVAEEPALDNAPGTVKLSAEESVADMKRSIQEILRNADTAKQTPPAPEPQAPPVAPPAPRHETPPAPKKEEPRTLANQLSQERPQTLAERIKQQNTNPTLADSQPQKPQTLAERLAPLPQTPATPQPPLTPLTPLQRVEAQMTPPPQTETPPPPREVAQASLPYSPEPPTPKAETPVVQPPAPRVETPVQPPVAPTPPPVHHPILSAPPTPPPTRPEAPVTLADQLSNRPATLADSLKSTPKTAAPGGPRLSVDQIPLHKQFQFVQKVFAGNSNRFKDTLAALSACGSYDDAHAHLATRILNMPEVNREDPVVQEFMQYVKSKFE